MASKLFIAALICLFNVYQVSAQMDPCQCLMQEYCCGGTSCCFAFYKVWYFWASIGFLILAFAAMITWLRYRRMQLERTHYIILQGEAAPGVIEKLGLSSNSNTQFCPPPYKS
ncbi:hypothetical protein TrispH2_007136 [Trichoplax sp. H2]|nr:hypothetical protein TrispH2_007136 [Trichoplax sp. H2]|eukprot:RDD40183.1 hypothetical protein TrispH2_007136 [Trichoplax sp. H2]